MPRKIKKAPNIGTTIRQNAEGRYIEVDKYTGNVVSGPYDDHPLKSAQKKKTDSSK